MALPAVGSLPSLTLLGALVTLPGPALAYVDYCTNPDTLQTCSGHGTCKSNKCKCRKGYHGNTCQHLDNQCGQLSVCAECQLLGSGALVEGGDSSCSACKGVTKPTEGTVYYGTECLVRTYSGCTFQYEYGRREYDGVPVGSSRVSCPEAVPPQCMASTNCSSCLAAPGCSWCSDPASSAPRCREEAANTCGVHHLMARGEAEVEKTEDTAAVSRGTLSTYSDHLHPGRYRVRLAPGQSATITFTYLFVSHYTRLSHDFPPGVEVQFWSDCAGWGMLETDTCRGMFNGHTAKFVARITLKHCPTKALDWQRSYRIELETHNQYLGVDLTTTCFCSCDQFINPSGAVCQESGQDYLGANPCAASSSCGDCLRSEGCNWCPHPDYAFLDGNPLPRCNNDTHFATWLCPGLGAVDPPAAWTGGCRGCTHSCEAHGGVCEENTQDITEGDVCPSLETCSSCSARGCSWCSRPPPGQPSCRSNLANLTCAEEDMSWGARVTTPSIVFEHSEPPLMPKAEATTRIWNWVPGGTVLLDLVWNIAETRGDLSQYTILSGQSGSDRSRYLKWDESGRDEELKDQYSVEVVKVTPKCKVGMEEACRGWNLEAVSTLTFRVALKQRNMESCSPHDGFNSHFLSLRKSSENFIYLNANSLNEDDEIGRVHIEYSRACGGCGACLAADCHRNVRKFEDFGGEFCDRGDHRCGRCECPEGFSGARCQCQGGAPAPPPAATATASPTIVLSPEAHSILPLLRASGAGEPLKIAAAIAPQGCDTCRMTCNEQLTRCQNPNFCSLEPNSENVWRKNNMMVMYGSQRLVPGSTFTTRITFCEDEDLRKRTFVGIGRPPTQGSAYSLPQDQMGRTVQHWTGEAFMFNIGDKVWRAAGRSHAWYQWANPNCRWGGFCDADSPDGLFGARITYDMASNITMEVTDTQLIWRMDGYLDESKEGKVRNWTYFRHPINITEEEFYPLFAVAACKDQTKSVIEIVNSNIGN